MTIKANKNKLLELIREHKKSLSIAGGIAATIIVTGVGANIGINMYRDKILAEAEKARIEREVKALEDAKNQAIIDENNAKIKASEEAEHEKVIEERASEEAAWDAMVLEEQKEVNYNEALEISKDVDAWRGDMDEDEFIENMTQYFPPLKYNNPILSTLKEDRMIRGNDFVIKYMEQSDAETFDSILFDSNGKYMCDYRCNVYYSTEAYGTYGAVLINNLKKNNISYSLENVDGKMVIYYNCADYYHEVLLGKNDNFDNFVDWSIVKYKKIDANFIDICDNYEEINNNHISK